MQLRPYFEELLEGAGYPAGDTRVWLAAAIAALAIMAGTFAVSWFMARVGVRLLRRLASRTETDLDDRLLDIVDRPLRRAIIALGLYLAILELPLPRRLAVVLSGMVVIYVAVAGARVATQLSLLLLAAYGRKVDDELGKERFHKDYVPLLSKLFGTIFFVVALIYTLSYFGQNVTSLVAALGIGGAAIGLAAKDTLGHMFAGFVILVDRPFRPGDRIKLATGETGDVQEVGTRSTRIRLLDGNMLIMPNSDLMNTRVVNLSYPAHPTQALLELRIAYGSDVEAVKELVLAVARDMPEVLADPAPAATFTAFGEHALLLTLSYFVSQFGDAAKVQERVRIEVYRRFREAGVRIPFPTREIIGAAR